MLDDPFVLLSGLKLRNRTVVAPMTTYSSYDDGRIREDELPYLRRRAEGGFGMVMTAACCVHPRGKAFDGQWACWSDEFLPSLRSVAEAIHESGAAAVLQIHHGGRACPSRLCGGVPLSASAIPFDRPNAETPRAMAESEIEEAIRSFADAAARAKEAGFDGVEIHGANTYLLQQFVSPHSNRRKDAWGQDRLKFPLAVTDAVLAAVGPGFSVGYRFSPEEPFEPGIRLPETYALVDALLLRDLDGLHVSLKRFDQPSIVGDFDDPTLALLSRRIESHSRPGRRPAFIGVGQVKTAEDFASARALGADLVALGRAAISEPEWPSVVESGGSPRALVPAAGSGEALTLPELLARKIESTEGWFSVEGKWDQA